MATIATGKALFQSGQTCSAYPWPGDFHRNIGERRPAAIATAAAAADGSVTITNAGLIAAPAEAYAQGYLVEGQRWPAGGGVRQIVSTAA
jgi:hypothetical protein